MEKKLEQEPSLCLRFKGDHSVEFSGFNTLINEIKKHKPDSHIQQASIAKVNNESILFIRTKYREFFEYLSSNWPSDAFRSGIKLIKNNLKFFVAIRGVSRKNDLSSSDDLIQLQEEYGLSNMMRILDSNKERTTIVNAEVDTEERMISLVKRGVYINNYYHNVSMWTFKSIICYKCQIPGHIAKYCEPSSKQICKHCGGEHSFKDYTT